MKKVDLNCDLGESFGAYKIGLDGEVIPYISSANIACGFHASDPVVMAHTVAMAKEHGCSVGAHPGFPDLMGFGRRQMQITPEEAKDYIIYQVGALAAFCRSQGIRLHHVKPQRYITWRPLTILWQGLSVRESMWWIRSLFFWDLQVVSF